jgi:hypothetical protein
LLFHRLARHHLGPRAARLALTLFAVLPSLIYYSSEVKQYSSDVFWTLVCLVAAPGISPKRWSVRALWGWGLLGAVVLWFSFPVVFVLAGLALLWTVERCLARDWPSVLRIGVTVSIWLVSFGVDYWVQLRHVSYSSYFADYWSGRFMPLPPESVSALGWFVDTFFQVFRYPVGLDCGAISLAGIGVLLFILGCTALWSEQRRLLCLLVAPVLFALLASGLHKYPFAGRLLLFLLPGMVLILAVGLEHVRVRTAASLPFLGTLLLGLLFLGPVLTMWKANYVPHGMEESRPVLEEVRGKWQKNDLMYLYPNAEPAFAYYGPRLGYAPSDVVIGEDHRDDWSGYRAELRRLGGRQRVWILFSHIQDAERKYLLACLDELGTRKEVVSAPGAAAYLYELR